MVTTTPNTFVNTSPFYSLQLRKFVLTAIVTLVAFIFALVYLMPFGNMAITAVKSQEQLTGSSNSPVLPMTPIKYTFEDAHTTCTMSRCLMAAFRRWRSCGPGDR